MPVSRSPAFDASSVWGGRSFSGPRGCNGCLLSTSHTPFPVGSKPVEPFPWPHPAQPSRAEALGRVTTARRAPGAQPEPLPIRGLSVDFPCPPLIRRPPWAGVQECGCPRHPSLVPATSSGPTPDPVPGRSRGRVASHCRMTQAGAFQVPTESYELSAIESEPYRPGPGSIDGAPAPVREEITCSGSP